MNESSPRLSLPISLTAEYLHYKRTFPSPFRTLRHRIAMRIQPLIAPIAIAIGCAAIPRHAFAQNIGTLIGANISTISEANKGVSDVFGSALNKKKRVGLKGGFYLKIPLAGMFSLEPELLYAQNGFTYEPTAPSGENFSVDLGYIEVPVLLRVDISPKSHLHPMLLIGGSGAARVQCKF